MDARIKALEAELVVARLEADFVEAKLKGNDTAEQRIKLEKARREYRQKWRTPTGVQPSTIQTSAKSKDVGG